MQLELCRHVSAMWNVFRRTWLIQADRIDDNVQ